MLPATNYRVDEYGGDAVRRLNFVKEILEGIREHTSSGVTTVGRANDAPFNVLRNRHDDVHVLGNPYAPRRIWFATRQAYELAQRI